MIQDYPEHSFVLQCSNRGLKRCETENMKHQRHSQGHRQSSRIRCLGNEGEKVWHTKPICQLVARNFPSIFAEETKKGNFHAKH